MTIPYSLMIKPVGPTCNLDCRYCYYKDQPGRGAAVMDDATVDAIIRHHLRDHPGPEVPFAWQGGEPTAAGLDFFERVIARQRELSPNGTWASNSLQTNGTLLDEHWAAFLKRERFLIGISIDGPAAIHDQWRPTVGGQGSHHQAVRGLRLLQDHAIDHAVLCTVHAGNQDQPEAVYSHLRQLGARYIQFIPIVERQANGELAGPPEYSPDDATLTAWSVDPDAYGRFLNTVFDLWRAQDRGRIGLNVVDTLLSSLRRGPPGLCVFAKQCGNHLVIERDGSIFSCDHFVHPRYRQGSIHQHGPAQVLANKRQRHFGASKERALARRCKRCRHLRHCHGGCPKHRFVADGAAAHSYLCSGYQTFFDHAIPRLHAG
ncbi:MAG: anaerobic sulfatase maturase [Planctomycetota bacterium]